MKAGYKVANRIKSTGKVIVVANLPLTNKVHNFSVESEKEAKEQKDDYDIGFWRIKRKETIKAK